MDDDDDDDGTMHISFLYILQVGERRASLSCRVTQAWVLLGLSQMQGLVSCFNDTITQNLAFVNQSLS